ncbi:ABC transporter permease [Salibacterium qingdaonense]|uniref:Putative ABC transport system permease protein n=1 Tax=Salibacterium qingdaonense TaxID=266892 RepID=A0A1I4HUT3_9BACI|nr:FtsX-like permease family protein [Salibacterium qingdaonense]SFL45580.1 putative ABC transport system permease protein [Salibacterium qingdaonense]
MLVKLAWNGMKSKRKDYIILLTGLVMSIAIFYMFQTLALNKDFTSDNAMISSMQLVFHVGSFLLAVITFFYLLYTNTFLLSLRQREYGMFLLLGAKKSHLKRLMFLENLLIGTAALVVGIAAGTVLSGITAGMVMGQLGEDLEGYHSFYLPSLVVTLLFFLLLFVVTAVWNHIKLSKVQVLELVHADTTSDRMPSRPKVNIVMMAAGIISLTGGWLSLIFMEQLREKGILSAAILTTLGTYLLFSSLLPVLLKAVKEKGAWKEKGIRAFTLSQLTFRVQNLKKFLATAAMLIALGAGAISGGMAFKNNAPVFAEQAGFYDAVVHNAGPEEEEILDDITFTDAQQYRYKKAGDYTFYLKEDLENQPPKMRTSSGGVKILDNGLPEDRESLADVKAARDPGSEWTRFLQSSFARDYSKKPLIVNRSLYESIDAEEEVVFAGKSDDFMAYHDEFAALDQIKEQKMEAAEGEHYYSQSKYGMYESYQTLATGTVFMGFFLGTAFLAMMASCLMFKVLSGAAGDVPRYRMLQNIGVSRDLLKRSVAAELFIIFLIPAVLGLAHVLIGMNMFSFILLEPYYRIWVSLLVFIVLYFLYYGLTVKMYQGMVLPQRK